MEELLTYVAQTASFITQMSVIGTLLIWVYNKFIGDPKEKRRLEEADRRAKERDDYMAEALSPITTALNEFNDFSKSSAADRLKLWEETQELKNATKILDKTSDDHEIRLVKVETTLDAQNGSRTVRYVEKYGEENEE